MALIDKLGQFINKDRLKKLSRKAMRETAIGLKVSSRNQIECYRISHEQFGSLNSAYLLGSTTSNECPE